MVPGGTRRRRHALELSSIKLGGGELTSPQTYAQEGRNTEDGAQSWFMTLSLMLHGLLSATLRRLQLLLVKLAVDAAWRNRQCQPDLQQTDSDSANPPRSAFSRYSEETEPWCSISSARRRRLGQSEGSAHIRRRQRGVDHVSDPILCLEVVIQVGERFLSLLEMKCVATSVSFQQNSKPTSLTSSSAPIWTKEKPSW